MSDTELNNEEIRVGDYVDVDYSDRRGEIYVTTIAGDTLFNLTNEQCSEYSESILEDPSTLKDTILKEYMDVITDMLPKFEYYGKIINPDDSAYYEHLYLVQIEHNSGYVFAYYENEALERLAGYLADKEQLGGLYTRDEAESFEKTDEMETSEVLDDAITERYTYIDCSEYTKANEWCFYTPIENLNITQVK